MTDLEREALEIMLKRGYPAECFRVFGMSEKPKIVTATPKIQSRDRRNIWLTILGAVCIVAAIYSYFRGQ